MAKKTLKLNARVSPEFQAFANEAFAPSVVTCDDVNASLSPTCEASGLALQQVAAWRTALGVAEMAPHDPVLDAKFEHMHQTLAVIEREAQASMLHQRELAKAFRQWVRYVEAMPDDVENIFRAADQIAADKAATPVNGD